MADNDAHPRTLAGDPVAARAVQAVIAIIEREAGEVPLGEVSSSGPLAGAPIYNVLTSAARRVRLAAAHMGILVTPAAPE